MEKQTIFWKKLALKSKAIHCSFIALFFIASASAQFYQSKSYTFSIATNIEYGKDTTFEGTEQSLKLDIYKPNNDTNCKRPIMLVVHGGSWLAGDKADGGIVNICKEFAARGYVVASVNYRMGMHPSAYYVPYALCVQPKCSYVADSAEFYRALYRAQQDVKGAIRFMKNRSATDSTDVENVYLLGESAGAFTCNYAAFMDSDLEKPEPCNTLADAPTPDADVQSCVSGTASKKRPDLGPYYGRLNLGNHDYRVKGVASFFGGTFDPKIFKNSSSSDTPDLYLYHQTCDVVVDNNTGRIFWKVYYYCYDPVNLCQPHSTGPVSYGSTSIKGYLDTAGFHKPRISYTLLTAKGAYSCNTSDNCHGTDNVPLRCSDVAQFFSARIQNSGNNPATNCSSGSIINNEKPEFRIYPNAASKNVTIAFSPEFYGKSATYILTGMDGKTFICGQIENILQTYEISLINLIPGTYFLCVRTEKTMQCEKIITIEN